MLKVRILWAEDNPVTFDHYSGRLCDFLKGKDVLAEIVRAVDGDAVFRYLASDKQRFDLLLSDIEMADFNGLDTVRELSRLYPGLQMLVVTSYLTEYESETSELLEKKIIHGYFPLEPREAWWEATWKAVTRRAPTILHLSDIHFGRDHAFHDNLKIDELLRLALRLITVSDKIDLVVVSGDLASEGTEDEFRQADEFLSLLADSLQLGLDRFVIVPGNHDIYRGEEPSRRFTKFVEFLDGFYGKLPDPRVAFERFPALYDSNRQRLHWSATSHSEESLFSMTIYDEIQTVVIGLNSVIASSDARLDLSKIEPMQLIKVNDALSGLGPPRSDYLRIAVFHHNPFPVPSFSAEGEPERLVRNPALVLHELIKNKVKLALHGHTHYSIGFKYLPFFLDGDRESSSSISVLGSGTLSGKDLSAAQSYYHLTVIRCELNEEGVVQSAVLKPYRLKDDRISWNEITPVKIDFQ